MYFRSLIVVFLTFAYIFIVGPPVILHAMLTGQTDTLYRVGRWGTRMVLWLAGVKLEVTGLEKIPKDRAVVFMPNHQSYGDAPAVISILPPILALGKKEFFRVPIIGWSMRLRGFIPVDRKNRERAIRAVDEATERLKAGESFVAFPEGTRSPDGRLGPFKKGVFVMAINAGAPIIPMSISGSYRIMRKDNWAIHPGVVRITLHDAVPTAGTTMHDRADIMARVRQAILTGLTSEEQPREENGERRKEAHS